MEKEIFANATAIVAASISNKSFNNTKDEIAFIRFFVRQVYFELYEAKKEINEIEQNRIKEHSIRCIEALERIGGMNQ